MKNELWIETILLNGDILGIVLDGSLTTTTSEQFNKAVQDHLDQGRDRKSSLTADGWITSPASD